MMKKLTAKDMITLHQYPVKHVNLPGKKELIPKNTEEESTNIKSILNIMRQTLSAERVERRNNRSEAVWVPETKCAKVTRRVGNIFPQYGLEKNGQIFLSAEECLFLIQVNRLELLWNGVPFSVEQAYAVLLTSSQAISKYRTYQELSLLGYRVQDPDIIKKRQHSAVDKYESVKKLKPSTSTNDVFSSSENETEVSQDKISSFNLLDKLKLEGPSTANISMACAHSYNLYLPTTCMRDKKHDYEVNIRLGEEQLTVQSVPNDDEPEVLTSLSGISSVSFYQLQKVDFDNL